MEVFKGNACGRIFERVMEMDLTRGMTWTVWRVTRNKRTLRTEFDFFKKGA